MHQKLFIAYGTTQGDEELFVTFQFYRFMTFDLVKSPGTDVRFCAELIDAYTRYIL